MENKFNYKKFFINYGILIAIIGFIFLVMIYTVKLSRKSWQNNLKVCVEKVLEENYPDTWNVGQFVFINNPLSLSAACYEISNKKTGGKSSAVIIRDTSFYGPVSVVFICDENLNVEFAGYSSLHGRIEQQLLNKKSDKRLEYWQNKIPEIIGAGNNE